MPNFVTFAVDGKVERIRSEHQHFNSLKAMVLP